MAEEEQILGELGRRKTKDVLIIQLWNNSGLDREVLELARSGQTQNLLLKHKRFATPNTPLSDKDIFSWRQLRGRRIAFCPPFICLKAKYKFTKVPLLPFLPGRTKLITKDNFRLFLGQRWQTAPEESQWTLLTRHNLPLVSPHTQRGNLLLDWIWSMEEKEGLALL